MMQLVLYDYSIMIYNNFQYLHVLLGNDALMKQSIIERCFFIFIMVHVHNDFVK